MPMPAVNVTSQKALAEEESGTDTGTDTGTKETNRHLFA